MNNGFNPFHPIFGLPIEQLEQLAQGQAQAQAQADHQQAPVVQAVAALADNPGLNPPQAANLEDWLNVLPPVVVMNPLMAGQAAGVAQEPQGLAPVTPEIADQPPPKPGDRT